MGRENDSEARKATNEVAFKHYNQQIEELASAVLTTKGTRDFPISFVCECSNLDCTKRIEIPLDAYAKVRKNEKEFILVPGNEDRSIEHVTRKEANYYVVEKYSLQ
jgi:hypothetical protein